MTEIYVAIGESTDSIEPLIQKDRLQLILNKAKVSILKQRSSHSIDSFNGNQITVLVVGDIYSIKKSNDQYTPISTQNNAKFIFEKYTKCGIQGVKDLNGDFAVFIIDLPDSMIKVITDRLGTVPVFKYKDDNDLRLSTNIQLFADDLNMTPRYDLDYLTEFFMLQRVYGTKTPLERVEKLHPGSITEYHIQDLQEHIDVYWSPEYRPKQKNYSYFVDEFVDRIQSTINERIDESKQYGLLLSGGSDSRLLAHLLPEDTVAYHMNDTVNKEAETAKRIAEEVSFEFTFLSRKKDYYFNVIEKENDHDNFTSWFHESHSVGFDHEFEAVDELVTGLFADILFRGFYVPQISIHIPYVNWKTDLPIILDVDSSEDIIEYRAKNVAFNKEIPAYYKSEKSLSDILGQNISMHQDNIYDHGVSYSSLQSALFSYYPLTNDYARDYFSMMRVKPRWSPFLDNRLIDLQLQIPIKYMIKRNIINDSIAKLNEDLLRIPHSDTGIGLHRSNVYHIINKWKTDIERKTNPKEQSTVIRATQGSWTDHQALFENSHLVESYLNQHKSLLRRMDFIDEKKLYEDLQKSKSYSEFYPLLTILGMPLTERIHGMETEI